MQARLLYDNIALPDQYVVLGQTLKPLTIGHCRLLSKLGLESQPASLPDLALRVSICCQSYSEFERSYCSLWQDLKVALWGCLCWFLFRKTIEIQIEQWVKYYTTHTTWPDVFNKSGGAAEESSIPFIQRLRGILISRAGYNPETFDSQPLLQCMWDHFTLAEAEGLISVLPDGQLGDFETKAFKMADEFHERLTHGS